MLVPLRPLEPILVPLGSPFTPDLAFGMAQFSINCCSRSHDNRMTHPKNRF